MKKIIAAVLLMASFQTWANHDEDRHHGTKSYYEPQLYYSPESMRRRQEVELLKESNRIEKEQLEIEREQLQELREEKRDSE